MKRHKKVLFDQIKEEDQGKRKKRSSTIYYFATEAFLNTSLSRGFRIGNTVYSVFKARKKTPLTYQEVLGANVLPLTEIFSKYFS